MSTVLTKKQMTEEDIKLQYKTGVLKLLKLLIYD